MKLEQLMTEWAKDSEINTNDLVSESTRPPKLHSKYYQELLESRLLLQRLEERLVEMEDAMERYFGKVMPIEEMDALGLPVDPRRYLKNDIDRMVSVHPKVVEIKTKVGVQKEKVRFIEDIVKIIHNMNFAVKNCIDAKKLSAGVY